MSQEQAEKPARTGIKKQATQNRATCISNARNRAYALRRNGRLAMPIHTHRMPHLPHRMAIMTLYGAL
jgi:hypothetical protein